MWNEDAFVFVFDVYSLVFEDWQWLVQMLTLVQVTWLIQMLMYFTGLVALIFPPNALLVLGECLYTFSIGLGVQRQTDCKRGL